MLQATTASVTCTIIITCAFARIYLMFHFYYMLLLSLTVAARTVLFAFALRFNDRKRKEIIITYLKLTVAMAFGMWIEWKCQLTMR